MIQDIPGGEIEVYLRVNRRPFKCDHCLKPFSEELDLVNKRQKYTLRSTHFITKQFVNSDFKSVAERNNLTESEVESMINFMSPKFLPINLKILKRLGRDEISLFKRLGNFMIVLVI